MRRISKKLPFVLVNMAITADGKIATANRAVSTFGSRRDHDHLYEHRATADAVMCGARTLDLNPYTVGTGGLKYQRRRLKAGLAEYNLRVIVSGSGSINPKAEVFKHRFSPILILTTERAGAKRLKALSKLADEVLVCGEREIDFAFALQDLRARWQVKRLLCEGGGELNAAMFQAGLVNELHLTVCPKIVGGRTAPTIADGVGAKTLSDATHLKLIGQKRHGDEIFLTYRILLTSR